MIKFTLLKGLFPYFENTHNIPFFGIRGTQLTLLLTRCKDKVKFMRHYWLCDLVAPQVLILSSSFNRANSFGYIQEITDIFVNAIRGVVTAILLTSHN